MLFHSTFYLTMLLARQILISDGRISEDSAVDLGDIITDEEEIIEELIKRGTHPLLVCRFFTFGRFTCPCKILCTVGVKPHQDKISLDIFLRSGIPLPPSTNFNVIFLDSYLWIYVHDCS